MTGKRNRALRAVEAGHIIRCFLSLPQFRIDLAFICGKVRRRRAAVQLARTGRARKPGAKAFAFIAYHPENSRNRRLRRLSCENGTQAPAVSQSKSMAPTCEWCEMNRRETEQVAAESTAFEHRLDVPVGPIDDTQQRKAGRVSGLAPPLGGEATMSAPPTMSCHHSPPCPRRLPPSVATALCALVEQAQSHGLSAVVAFISDGHDGLGVSGAALQVRPAHEELAALIGNNMRATALAFILHPELTGVDERELAADDGCPKCHGERMVGFDGEGTVACPLCRPELAREPAGEVVAERIVAAICAATRERRQGPWEAQMQDILAVLAAAMPHVGGMDSLRRYADPCRARDNGTSGSEAEIRAVEAWLASKGGRRTGDCNGICGRWEVPWRQGAIHDNAAPAVWFIDEWRAAGAPMLAGEGTMHRCKNEGCYIHEGESCAVGHMRGEHCPAWGRRGDAPGDVERDSDGCRRLGPSDEPDGAEPLDAAHRRTQSDRTGSNKVAK